MAKWKGPGLITRIHGDITAEVQMEDHKFSMVHIDLLKPCTPRYCSPVAQANLQAYYGGDQTHQTWTQTKNVETQMDLLEDSPDSPAGTTTGGKECLTPSTPLLDPRVSSHYPTSPPIIAPSLTHGPEEVDVQDPLQTLWP